MPRFTSKEEYEKWKAQRAKENAERQKQAASEEEQTLYCKMAAWGMQALFVCAWIIIVIFFLSFIAPHITGASSYPFVGTALGIEQSISGTIQDIVPAGLGNLSIIRWSVIITALLASGWFDNRKRHFRIKATTMKVRKEFEDLRATMRLPQNAKVLAPIQQKLDSLKGSSKQDRNELLRLFAETKRKLDTMGQDLAFLAIDIVNSTGMKQGEEKAIIEHDFVEYKKFVEEKMKANGALKSAWTPDGVMICFASVEGAVRTAQDVLYGLDDFNRDIKSMRQDFQVRCGINSGLVYFDESMPLEEISDRVIDVAGHMQKYAEPNTVSVSKPTIESAQNSEGFVPAAKVVDGYEVYTWQKP